MRATTRGALLSSLCTFACAASQSGTAETYGRGQVDTDTETETSSTGGATGRADTSSDPGTFACEPTLASIAAQIFAPHCFGNVCHGIGTKSAGGLDLESPGLEARLVRVAAGTCEGALVQPGDAGASVLYAKLLPEVPCGLRMPVAQPALPDAALACISGWIAGLPTMDPAGCETCGGSVCVDLATDSAHCGACDQACPAGLPCEGGACVCPGAGTLCGSTCVDVASDPAHCGGCDQACAGEKVCLAGACSSDCGGLSACDGACVDLTTDKGHCGGCNQACAAGQACEGGACTCAGPAVDFATDIAPVLEANCASSGCHGAQRPKEGLALTAAKAYAELVGVASAQCQDARPLVTPGEPAASYLMAKLRGVDLCSGSQMPKAGVSLAPAELAAIEAWICRGAMP